MVKSAVSDIQLLSLSLLLPLPLPLSLSFSSLDSLCSCFDKEDDEWCDEEVLQLNEELRWREETEGMEQSLDEEKCTGVEGAIPTPKWCRVARDAGLAASLSFGH